MRTIKIKQINEEYVRPVHYQSADDDDRPIKGASIFPEIYCNVYIEAKKKSGKSTVVNKIVRQCSTKETTVMVFCSTKDKDKNHLALKQYCKGQHIPYISYTSMKDDDVDVLDVLIKRLQEQAEAEQEPESDEEEEEEPNRGLILFDSSESEDEDEPKKRKAKFKAPEYLIILDDLSNELKSKTLVKLMKMNRHYKCKIVISSQYFLDLLPESRKQCDFCLVFNGEPEVKLQQLHKDFDLAIDFEVFKKLYYHATSKKFSFLYIDIRNEQYRMNFTHRFMI